jgi:hypothetical protein
MQRVIVDVVWDSVAEEGEDRTATNGCSCG